MGDPVLVLLHVVVVVIVSLHEIEAVLRKAKVNGRPPLTRADGERRVSVPRGDVQLVPTHSQLICIVEQPSPEAVAKLQRLRIQGYDLIVYRVASVLVVEYRAKEKAARREHMAGDAMALEPVLGDGCAVVSGTTQLRIFGVIGALENRVVDGSHQVGVVGYGLQDTHAAVEDVHLPPPGRPVLTHHQSAIGSGCHLQTTVCVDLHLLWELEPHLLQPAAPWSFVGRLPPDQPLRAHRCSRPILRL
eukprot:scaffold7155_cov63-Phaeocystis_antarctica.AAC.3